MTRLFELIKNNFAVFGGLSVMIAAFAVFVSSMYAVRHERSAETGESALLIKGKVVQIEPGLTLPQIAQRCVSAGLVTEEVFWSVITDPKFLSSTGVDAPTFEGYFLPGSYTVEPGTHFLAFLAEFTNRRRREISKLSKAYGPLPMPLSEVFVLASIATAERQLGASPADVIDRGLGLLLNGSEWKSEAVEHYFSSIRSESYAKAASKITRRGSGMPNYPICSVALDLLDLTYKKAAALTEKPS